MQHEIQEHFLKGISTPATSNEKLLQLAELAIQKTVVCRLCRQSLIDSKKYASHVAKHMESIALAALPQTAYDSDDLALSSDTDDGEEAGVRGTETRIHTTYRCSLCEAIFRDGYTLRQHLRRHIPLSRPEKPSEVGSGASVEIQGDPWMGAHHPSFESDLSNGENASSPNLRPSDAPSSWPVDLVGVPEPDLLVEPHSGE